MTSPIPALRLRSLSGARERPPDLGDYVLYWMVAQRRTRSNFALQHAAWHAARLRKPLVVLEPLRVGYPYACDRFHHFILDGMADNAARFAAAGVRYLPYVEREAGAGKGLLAALAARACVVVSDDYPCFFIPRMQAAAVAQLRAPFELVDSNGIMPLRAADSAFTTAHGFRRFVQHHAIDHLLAGPLPDPLAQLAKLNLAKPELPAGIGRWPLARPDELKHDRRFVGALAIDHSVGRTSETGGSIAAERRLAQFVDESLDRYVDDRNHPDRNATSGLSAWLHFGHLGAHAVVSAVLEHEGWDPFRLGDPRVTRGNRNGWWGVGPGAEAFLDQVVTWRELGQNFCWHTPNYDHFSTLPSWARKTLAEHRNDPRPELYALPQLEAGETGDPIWNAAQRQLVVEGRMHNYLRMLWGKRILEWSPTPERALERMIVLNDKYALDGRDPNSYSGIFWVLGRYDRAWGPERPIFGKIRYMSTANTRRKLNLDGYVRRWSSSAPERFGQPELFSYQRRTTAGLAPD